MARAVVHLSKAKAKAKASLKGKSVSKYSLIFLATIISKSISVLATSDLNLSDDNYEHIHKHQYEGYPSAATAQAPRILANYQWFYNSNDNTKHMNVGSNEQPSALTQIDRFFSTGRFSDSTSVSGHFPFDYHQNKRGRPSRHTYERSMLSIPSIPDIPPVPPLEQQIHLSYPSSTYFLQKDRDLDYRHQNNYQNNGKNINNDYNHGIKDYTTHDNKHNKNYWHFAHNSGHSYHHSYDSATPNHDSFPNTFWSKPFNPTFSSHFDQRYGPDLQHQPRTRTRREHFSRRSSYEKDGKQRIPEINEQIIKNNAFYKESQFSWNIEQNDRPKHQLSDFTFK